MLPVVVLKGPQFDLEGEGLSESAGGKFSQVVIPDIDLFAGLGDAEEELVVGGEPHPLDILAQAIFLIDLILEDAPDDELSSLVGR